MNELWDYNNKTIKITDKYGEIFSGAAEWYPWEYNRDEFNVEEESLQIGDNIIFKSEISSIEILRNEVCIPVRNWPEAFEEIALWFHERWHIPLEAYRESIRDCLGEETGIPQWYVVVRGNRIIAGCGVIENDFHERRDFTPNLCAVYVDEEFRDQGIAGFMLQFACDDMSSMGVDTLYLLTDHIGFYERYGWNYLCMARGNDGELSRMYVHYNDSEKAESELEN